MSRGASELIVDGNNVAWAWPRARPLLLRAQHGAAQRLLVAATLGSPLRGLHAEITFVFDGPPPATGPVGRPGALVLYPDPGQSADERILELVERARGGGPAVVVVTSDRSLQELARAKGATTMGGMKLLAAIDPRSAPPRRAGRPERRPRTEKPSPNREDTEHWLRRFGGPEAEEGGAQKTGVSR